MKIKMLMIVGIPLILLAVLVYITLPWLFIYIGIQLGPSPPSPRITYGEFPFRLEYEINGQRKVVEDTLICEFDGIGSDEGRGKFRKWNERLASKNEEIILLKVDDTKRIIYYPGSAEYYMGDLDTTLEHDSSFPNGLIIEKNDRITSTRLILADQLLEQYKIKLISWDYTQPIKNSF
ncbi:hypothetical protein [Paenibacillus alvei]|uniref:hypothetical protein n=1 Tax=Paenibacillus alvei TaxID=44250 RepID=UPI0018CCDBB5|nr:hypothetical protein [Paenibacillus alvei]MBG9736742.1 hypothetical protein [Paenibacillus alvei]MBG9746899.1 hypothetical protein [Paenibacillus alvei]MCY9583010.1 hypothetical protein [Paenibacillus alvei]MCY9588330.1 hypothetical protein [Paenibacillus alvei]